MSEQTPTTETPAPTAPPPITKTAPEVKTKDAEQKEAAASTPEAKAAEVKERDARRIALLTKERERIEAERSAFESTRKQQETEIGELRKSAEAFAAFEKLWQEDPIAALESRNLSFERLVDLSLERQTLAANPAIKEVRELKARLAAEEQQRKDAELQNVRGQHQRQIDNAVREIQTVIETNADKYEFLKTAGAAKDVFQRIYDVFTQTAKRDAQGRVTQPGQTLTAQEACDLLEAEYEESWKSIAGLKKVSAFFQSKQQPQDNDKNKAAAKSHKEERSPILSNSNTSGPAQAARMTKKEKTHRAFEAMRSASSRP